MDRFTAQREAWQQRVEEQRVAFFAAGGQCWACRDTGYSNAWQGDGEAPCQACAAGEALLQRLRAGCVKHILAASGLPRRYSAWSFETFPAAARKRATLVQRFAEKCDLASGHGLLLLGKASVGKTGLLVSAARCVIERQVATLPPDALRPGVLGAGQAPLRMWFTTDTTLLDGLRNGYADDTYHALIQRAKSCDLLVIDDFGKADYKGGVGWSVERLYDLLNARYSELRPTWFSTNLGVAQLQARLGEMGEPIMDRVLDACGKGITITGDKLRMGVSA